MSSEHKESRFSAEVKDIADRIRNRLAPPDVHSEGDTGLPGAFVARNDEPEAQQHRQPQHSQAESSHPSEDLPKVKEDSEVPPRADISGNPSASGTSSSGTKPLAGAAAAAAAAAAGGAAMPKKGSSGNQDAVVPQRSTRRPTSPVSSQNADNVVPERSIRRKNTPMLGIGGKQPAASAPPQHSSGNEGHAGNTAGIAAGAATAGAAGVALMNKTEPKTESKTESKEPKEPKAEHTMPGALPGTKPGYIPPLMAENADSKESAMKSPESKDASTKQKKPSESSTSEKPPAKEKKPSDNSKTGLAAGAAAAIGAAGAAIMGKSKEPSEPEPKPTPVSPLRSTQPEQSGKTYLPAESIPEDHPAPIESSTDHGKPLTPREPANGKPVNEHHGNDKPTEYTSHSSGKPSRKPSRKPVAAGAATGAAVAGAAAVGGTMAHKSSTKPVAASSTKGESSSHNRSSYSTYSPSALGGGATVRGTLYKDVHSDNLDKAEPLYPCFTGVSNKHVETEEETQLMATLRRSAQRRREEENGLQNELLSDQDNRLARSSAKAAAGK